MRDEKNRRVLHSVNNFLTFFLIVAFVVTCCMMLFLNIMADEMGIELNASGIETAAKITMLNVLLISLIITLCDVIRRKITIDRPAKKIIAAGRRIMKGDFNARVDSIKTFDPENRFKEISECINKMAEELSRTETLRTDFIANVSHEIKTPLAVMQNYGRLLQEENLPEDKRIEYARAINNASNRLANLVSNILKLNKLENQQIVLNKEKYNLSEQICESILQFEDLIENKGLTVETDIEDDVYVDSDREMMSIVWNNLISNAIKFTDREGTVFVSVSSTQNHATVTVRDTGCGISSQTGAHMFDKFYQGDTSHATEGNGLGLALVKRVIDITKSTISVESALGKGTEFTVRIRK